MNLNLPTSAKEVSERMKTDLQNELPVSNPFLPNSLLSAFVSSFSGRVYDYYLQLDIGINQCFVDTATGIYLERHGAIVGIYRNQATPAKGDINCTGIVGTVIPQNTAFQSSLGNQYLSTEPATIILQTINVLNISRVGGLVTVLTDVGHQFASGQTITITGADQPDYNGSFIVTVISPDEFQYTIIGTPLTPGTGTIIAEANMAVVNILSTLFGSSQNLPSGGTATVTTPISGLDSIARAEYFGVGGGTDIEDDPSYRARVIFRYQNPVSLFNPVAIEVQAKAVSGVTRVWVFEITPSVGEVTIYFVRDNDPSIIPGPSQIEDVYNAILKIKDAVTAPSFVIVDAPDPIPINFNFTSLVPNTPTMQSSITASLEAFFHDSTNVDVDLPEDAYRCAIFSTIDIATGDPVTSFTLSTPSGNIPVGPGQLPVLGNITYP